MPYSEKPAIFLEVTGLSKDLSDEFEEFLRLKVINSCVRIVNGIPDGKGKCSFSGVYSRKNLVKIRRWLKKNGHSKINAE